jgi:hypothetical protein
MSTRLSQESANLVGIVMAVHATASSCGRQTDCKPAGHKLTVDARALAKCWDCVEAYPVSSTHLQQGGKHIMGIATIHKTGLPQT